MRQFCKRRLAELLSILLIVSTLPQGTEASRSVGHAPIAGGLRFAPNNAGRASLTPAANTTIRRPQAVRVAYAPPQESRATSSGQLPGQSRTRLPDGAWLVIGGNGSDGPVGAAWVVDATTGSVTSVPDGLLHPRAWHTATVLPDGTVMIVGGMDANGSMEESMELFTPETGKFALVPGTVTPRAHHTATLLTDGRVLIVGDMQSVSLCRVFASQSCNDQTTLFL